MNKNKLNEAKQILKELGMPKAQQSDLCAYTLLALLQLSENKKWENATNEYIRIHDIMEYIKQEYDIVYAENSRETFRKQALHHFRIATIIEDNDKPTNSPNYRYRITTEAINLIKKYKSDKWEIEKEKYLKKHETLVCIYQNKRKLTKIPIVINGEEFEFSTGKHNELQKAIIEEFAPRFAQNSIVLYVGDTKDKDLYKDKELLKQLKISMGEHEKLPDIILYQSDKKWIYFIEAVTSVGPISPKRIIEINEMTKECKLGKIFVTAFIDMKTFKKFAEDLAWETEVWLSEMPDHMIHLNGDKIVKVNDIEATSMELTELVQHIRGEEGTKVYIQVYRESTGEMLDFEVERRNVVLPSIEGEMLEDGIGYIQITEFQQTTAQQFAVMVNDLKSQGMKGVIVDVRANPGGYLSSVNDILDMVLPEGLLVYTEDKYGNRNEYTSDASCLDIPLVVLVDGNSASASEIFAGAIKDYEWGTLVGTTTYGKGIVQNVIPLSDGDAMKITTSKYFTPKGNYIHEVGIEPDVVIEYEYNGPTDETYDKQYDNQFLKALEIMKEKLADE